ncbi:MAG: SufE family protein [Oscillospiraceae bacterium]|nr:SufE family protein [Oscillospiraceae bacterium]
MDHTLSLAELEDSYIEDLNTLEDWFLQYEYLLAISADLPHVAQEERTCLTRVRGCQSGVWLVLEYTDGKVGIRADSEALIIRGILSIVVRLLDGRTPEEIVAYCPRFIADTNIGTQISTDRFRGIHTVIETIQGFAAQHI